MAKKYNRLVDLMGSSSMSVNQDYSKDTIYLFQCLAQKYSLRYQYTWDDRILLRGFTLDKSSFINRFLRAVESSTELNERIVEDAYEVSIIKQAKKESKASSRKAENSSSLSFTNLLTLANSRSSVFYRSPEWRFIRYEAIKKYGNNCQACGTGPGKGVSIHVDHIKPRSLFPGIALDIDNLQILCEDCNLGKLTHDQTDWR